VKTVTNSEFSNILGSMHGKYGVRRKTHVIKQGRQNQEAVSKRTGILEENDMMTHALELSFYYLLISLFPK
jgi:hypothetical protein